MSVKLITENILSSDKFLSATEQEGEHIGQPVPDSANTGAFRLLSKGDIQDFTYSGTATGNGTTITMIDSVLCAFGDDYFISGTITFTGGENTSGTKTITDFAQSTGTITWSGAVNSTLTGDTFTLAVAFASRDIRVELIAPGDTGGATFKWSHDGGATYLGRDAPNQANWLAFVIIDTNGKEVDSATDVMVQTEDGNLLLAYNKGSASDVYRRISIDNGLTWGSEALVATIDAIFGSLLVMSTGRIWLHLANYLNHYYSDDNGSTWAQFSFNLAFGHVCELSNGNLLGVYEATNSIYCKISQDGGFNWSNAITIAADANDQKCPTVVVAKNGYIVCAYETDEDAVNDIEIKCKVSSDGGATWGSVISVIDYATADIQMPNLLKDVNGDLYCAASEAIADKAIVYASSSDNAVSWGAKTTLKAEAGKDLIGPCLALINKHEIVCVYNNRTDTDYEMVRRGMWEAYSANACPCAIEAIEQKLICDIGIVHHGGAGIAGDKWTIAPEYDYAMSNIIEDSPLKPWRSEQDNIACNIVIDLGANERFLADGVGFFGCNIRTLDFQMNATNSWGSPSVDESVSFDLATGTVDSVSGNYVNDASLLADYKDHELKANPHFLRMTSGTDNGVTWKILDNVGDYIVLDTTAATNISATDTFAIFQTKAAKTFTGGVHRFINIAIAAEHTADNYYQIGVALMGKSVTLSRGFRVGYSKDRRLGVEMLRPPKGGLIPIKQRDAKNTFSLTWPASEAAREEVVALVDYAKGKNIVLIPDDSDMTDCFLVKFIGDVSQKHRFRNRFDTGPLLFEEV